MDFELSRDARMERKAAGSVVDFLRLLWAVHNGMDRASALMEEALGLTGRERIVIRLVGRLPGISAGALAELLHLDPSSLTPILNELERQKLLEKRDDPRDRRRTLLGLTARGRELDCPDERSLEASLEAVLRRAPAQQLKQTRELLEALVHGLESHEREAMVGRTAAEPVKRRRSTRRRRSTG